MTLSRRSFFAGLGALLAAPAVVKVVSLMPPLEAARVRTVNYLTLNQITREMIERETIEMLTQSNAFLECLKGAPDGCQYGELFSSPNAKIGTTLRIRLPSDEWRKLA